MRMLAFALCVAVALGAVAQTKSPAAEPGKQKGFDASTLDRSADPCTDFYQYACGNWIKNNPIPADQVYWGSFSALYERNRAILHGILERSSADYAKRNVIEQKIGDYYASCMDEGSIEEKGLTPIRRQLDAIAGMKWKSDLPALVAFLHNSGVNVFFGFGSQQDYKDSKKMIAAFDQGGLNLPERDYYLKDDAKSKEQREGYVAHVARMLAMAGMPEQAAQQEAKNILALETALAKVSLPVVERREPKNLYHPMALAEFARTTPAFHWSRYLANTAAPKIDSANVQVPEFFKGMQAVIQATPLPTLKAYMQYGVLRNFAPLLPRRFVEENFDFHSRKMQGQERIQERWKRCTAYTNGDLGEALGIPYVELTFGADGKQRVLKMVEALQRALESDIHAIEWMGPETKKQALTKLSKIKNKIGYPEKWRDYSKLRIVRGDAVGNSQRANEFEFARQLRKIGQPVDPLEWFMSPPTVNAYYDPQMNNINFPAGILQPPFFDKTRDEAYNYGGIGGVIGHELTHGFDDEGRKFDADGNLRDWWTDADNAEFNKRAECFVDQYAGYDAVEGVKLNGKLTLGENVADGGGLRLGYMAAMASPDVPKTEVDGYSPEQRVFVGWGQIWCESARPEFARMLAQTDPHSLSKWRVNGTVANMPEFHKAFGCKAGQPMVRANACRVW